MTSVQGLEQRLSALSVGDRAWFWFCPDAEPPLLLESFSKKDGVRSLFQAASAAAVPIGASECSGIAAVSVDGTLHFGSPLLTEDGLLRLARWAIRHHAEAPGLCRLKNARFTRVGPDGRVQETLHRADLWAQLPSPDVPGSLTEAVQILASLPPAEGCWFWMQATSAAAPGLVFRRVDEDPEGKSFTAKVMGWREAIGERSPSIRGVASVSREGVLFLTSTSSVDQMSELLAAVLRSAERVPPLLDNVRFIELEQRAFSRMGAAERIPLPNPEDGLSALSAGHRLGFWFTTADRDGRPRLLLDADKQALKRAAVSVAGPGARVRGEVRRSRKGALVFRASSDAPDFIRELARWAAQNLSRWPGLVALRGAQLIVCEGETVLHRYRDEGAWDLVAENA